MCTRWPKLMPVLLVLFAAGMTMGIGSCVQVTPSSATLQVGQEVQLDASSNFDTSFTWRSTDPSVAIVNDSGLVSAIGEGRAYITATGNRSNAVGRAVINVEPADDFAVTIEAPGTQVNVNGTLQLQASSTDPDDTSFEWTSSNENVATVSATGLVTGLAQGSATITATGSHSGESDSVTIQVIAVEAQVDITEATASVPVGGTVQLHVTSTDPLDQYFEWTSSGAAATVDANGVVTGVSEGTVTITATGNHSGASDTAEVTVTPAGDQPPVANAGEDRTVGYNRAVELNGMGSSDPNNDPLTFAWTQVSGPAVTLTDATVANPSFTPTQPGQYVFQLIVTGNGVASEPDQVTITAINEGPTGTVDIEAISGADIEARGLTTGPSSGLHVVGVGTDVYLTVVPSDPNGDPVTGYAWVLMRRPSGSQAEIADPAARSIVFRPDVRGTYELGVTLTDNLGLAGDPLTQPIHAGEYVGVGLVQLAEDASGPDGFVGQLVPGSSTCTPCHNGSVAPDMITPWLRTAHATKLARDLNGITTQFYAQRCLECHTVGFNEDPAAVNGGFDDVQAELGWTLPQPLQPGNWESLVENYPALARVGNIQCESCHGPASEHPTAFFSEIDTKMGVTLDAGVCGQCHHEELQWEKSGHSDATSQAFTYPIGPNRLACVKCHSGEAYIDFATGATNVRTRMQTHTCAVCHDPHRNDNEAQLRIAGEAILPGETVVTEVGASATCMTCHNGRQAPAAAVNGSFPHYSTAAENLMAVNAVDYGKYEFGTSAHKFVANPAGQTLCVMCHMADTPGEEHDDQMAPGEDAVGEHTFKMRTDSGTPDDPTDDVANIESGCAVCHPGLNTFNREANGDYDGDGTIEGVQDEVSGLLEVVLEALEASGVEHVSHHPYWTGVTTDEQRQAIFNYELVNHDGSLGVHNTGFSVSVLQATYKEFTGEDVPNADIRYQTK